MSPKKYFIDYTKGGNTTGRECALQVQRPVPTSRISISFSYKDHLSIDNGRQNFYIADLKRVDRKNILRKNYKIRQLSDFQSAFYTVLKLGVGRAVRVCANCLFDRDRAVAGDGGVNAEKRIKIRHRGVGAKCEAGAQIEQLLVIGFGATVKKPRLHRCDDL